MAKSYTKSSVCERCGKSWVHSKYTHPRFCSSDCSNKRRGDNFEARFYARIDRSGGPDACWPWTGPTDKDGYGKVIHYSVGDTRAHRVALEFHRGLPLRSLPASVVVRHSCDTPPCCNPAHLLDGTHADNSDDKVQRDRHTKGEDINTARLTEAEVMEVRELFRDGFSIKSLCERFGLSKSAMHYAVKGKSWKHLPLVLLVFMMAVPAFAQTTHPFIKPDQSAAVVKESLTTASAVKAPAIAYGANHRFDRSFWLASGLFAAASTADIVTTHKALERGAVELNPFFAEQNGAGLRTSANVIATTGIWAIAAYCEKRGQRRFGRILLLTGAAIRTAAAFWNHNRRR